MRIDDRGTPGSVTPNPLERQTSALLRDRGVADVRIVAESSILISKVELVRDDASRSRVTVEIGVLKPGSVDLAAELAKAVADKLDEGSPENARALLVAAQQACESALATLRDEGLPVTALTPTVSGTSLPLEAHVDAALGAPFLGTHFRTLLWDGTSRLLDRSPEATKLASSLTPRVRDRVRALQRRQERAAWVLQVVRSVLDSRAGVTVVAPPHVAPPEEPTTLRIEAEVASGGGETETFAIALPFEWGRPPADLAHEAAQRVEAWLAGTTTSPPADASPAERLLARNLSRIGLLDASAPYRAPTSERIPLTQRALYALATLADANGVKLAALAEAIAGGRLPIAFDARGVAALLHALHASTTPETRAEVEGAERALVGAVRADTDGYALLGSIRELLPDAHAEHWDRLLAPSLSAGDNRTERTRAFEDAGPIAIESLLLPRGEPFVVGEPPRTVPAPFDYPDARRLGPSSFPPPDDRLGVDLRTRWAIWLSDAGTRLTFDASRISQMRAAIRVVESEGDGKHVEIVDAADRPIRLERAAWAQIALDDLVPEPQARTFLRSARFETTRPTSVLAVAGADPAEPPTFWALSANGRLAAICDDVTVIEAGGRMAYAVRKPVIYLYPTKPTEVRVRVEVDGPFIAQYPPMEHGSWTVLAQPSGELFDRRRERRYAYLFWEAERREPFAMPPEDCYCVASADTLSFLERLADRHALDARERTDFVSYWLPALEQNRYSLVRVVPEAEYARYARMSVEPRPDTVIRLFFVFQAVPEPVKVGAPELPLRRREGFTVVEWGGVNLDEAR